MQDDGIIIDKISPKYVIKQAYSSKYIDDVDIWLSMINDRNLMSHTYNFTNFMMPSSCIVSLRTFQASSRVNSNLFISPSFSKSESIKISSFSSMTTLNKENALE
jgi:hypothetical protein